MPELNIDFSKLPFPIIFAKLRKVDGYDIKKMSTDFLELINIIIAKELERTVHDPTVVKSSNN